MGVRILAGDCRARLAELADSSVDACVCDPPYELGFMGRSWDKTGIANDKAMWAEVLRVLKPGGHLVAFSGTRTYHRMVVAIEDAGFEIRDQLAWVYGSGFPKSLDVSKQIDKAAGVERAVVVEGRRSAVRPRVEGQSQDKAYRLGADASISAPATDAAREWHGWGTALKPSWEPICLARKQLIGTVAANVLAHGTGALNIDGCRIGTESTIRPIGKPLNGGAYCSDRSGRESLGTPGGSESGRWPANLCHDGSDEVLTGFPETQSGEHNGNYTRSTSKTKNTFGGRAASPELRPGDSGSAARFFAAFPIGEDEWEFAKSVHAAKSAESQCGSCGTHIAGGPAATLILGSNDAGSQAGLASIGICESCIPNLSHALSVASQGNTGTIPTIQSCSRSNGSAAPATASTTKSGERAREAVGSAHASATSFLYCLKATAAFRGEGNSHPTVKPVALMRWLVRLITPKGGTVLDPFMGSGSTLIAADQEQFDAIGCELSQAYIDIAVQRIHAEAGMFAQVEVD